MKKINFKKLYKKIPILVFAIYVIYTLISQQQILNSYKVEANKYTNDILQAQAEQEKLNETKNNINSNEYIEQIAREKLDMYYPNEKIYIDKGM